MTAIWYEILPVTLKADQVVALHRCKDGEAQNWLVPQQDGTPPNETVLEAVKLFFGDWFEPAASIVHSTSWRYCQQSGHFILTYLVVLPQQIWRYCLTTNDHIMVQLLGNVEQVHGDNLYPPERIEMINVLAHALDHLALLTYYDERIKAILETDWLTVLEKRLPKPAGYLARICR